MIGSSKEIDVIGAGPAGLVAAINLAKADFKVRGRSSVSRRLSGHRELDNGR